LALNAKAAIFQLYYGENKLIFNEMMMRPPFVLDQHAYNWIFIVLTHRNSSLRIDMSPTRTHYPDSQPTSICSFSW